MHGCLEGSDSGLLGASTRSTDGIRMELKKNLKRDGAADSNKPGTADLPLDGIVEQAVKRAMENTEESVNDMLWKEI